MRTDEILIVTLITCVYTHTLYFKMAPSTKLTTDDAQPLVFSCNYDVHSDDGDNVDFEDTDSNESSDFQGKNDSKASESELIHVCTDSEG